MASEQSQADGAALSRCFLCGARLWDRSGRALRWGERVRHFAYACGSCGVLTNRPDAGEACRAHLQRALGQAEIVSDPKAPYGFDAYTLRSAATLLGLWAEPSDAAQEEALRAPHSPLAGRARLHPLTGGPAVPFSLAILCRDAERERAMALAADARGWCDDVVIVIDGEGPAEEQPDLRIHPRPLDGHFGAQRNAAQRFARHEWVLQLDADETLEAEAAACLPGLLGRLGAETVSIGLRRSNLVDGAKADLFPDTQYRLNRRTVLYEGRVHERPDRPWQRSLLFLGGGLLHHLGRAHVEARSRRYEAMAPGGGRLFEEADLLRPYRD